jgi:hypothetical protein
VTSPADGNQGKESIPVNSTLMATLGSRAMETFRGQFRGALLRLGRGENRRIVDLRRGYFHTTPLTGTNASSQQPESAIERFLDGGYGFSAPTAHPAAPCWSPRRRTSGVMVNPWTKSVKSTTP